MYKKALHSFFLKVHPDFFGSSPQWQRTNEASIATLNELLDWAKAFKSGKLSPPPSKKIEVEFFRKPEDAEVSTQKITGSFELPQSFQPTDGAKGVAERAVNKFLRELLRNARCIDDGDAQISRAQDEALRKEESKATRTLQNKKRKSASTSKTLLDEAAESINNEWAPKSAPEIDDLIFNNQILFDRELSPQESSVALRTLTTHLPAMSYERWIHMPLIVSKGLEGGGFAVGRDVFGSISVPWNFTRNQFIQFLNSRQYEIDAAREEVNNLAKTVEGLITSVCKEFNCDDVLLTNMKQTEAIRPLRVLFESKDLLHAHGISDLSFEIMPAQRLSNWEAGNANQEREAEDDTVTMASSQQSTAGGSLGISHRANGVLVFPSNLDRQMLLDGLPKLAPKVAALKQVYADAKKMIDTTLHHIQKFKELVKPAAIHPFDDKSLYYHRLIWAKELARLGNKLGEWDWSDFTFALGPLEIDWDSNMVTLPHNFDSDAFVRYVRSVSEKQETDSRNQMLEGEAHKLMFEAKKTAEEIQAETPLSGGHPAAGSSDFESMSREGYTATQQQRRGDQYAGEEDGGIGEASVGASRERLAMGHHPASPAARWQREAKYQQNFGVGDADPNLPTFDGSSGDHLDEYLGHDPRGKEPLRFEAPLNHQVHFHSEEEADEQLRWEGFYDSPYAGSVPSAEMEDVALNYLKTNRNQRDAATKKMLKEMQESTKSHLKNFKLTTEDVVGLNYVKGSPGLKAHPTMAAGTYEGRRDKK